MRICESLLDKILNDRYWDEELESQINNVQEALETHSSCNIQRDRKAIELFWKIMAWRNDYWWD